MKIDTRIWNEPSRMRERIRNLATIVLTLSAMNSFILIPTRNWITIGINCLFFILTLPVFISYTKWQKEPPKEVENQ